MIISKFIYGFTIFLSAFLIFQVQPLMSKIILPRFGGSSGTWLVCLLFFQLVLVLGYTYSFLINRFLSLKSQSIAHIVLLILAVLFSFQIFSTQQVNLAGYPPGLAILLLLFLTIGFPYFTLSTTSPLLQAWYNSEFVKNKTSYRLFALSNVGSMLALLTYPIFVEPSLNLHTQMSSWLLGFIIFVVCCIRLAWKEIYNQSTEKTTSTNKQQSTSTSQKKSVLLWVLLSFAPSTLLMAATEHLTRDVAPIPLLWILPLTIYLLSFIFCFDSAKWYQRSLFVPVFVVSPFVFCWLVENKSNSASLFFLSLFLLMCFVVFMVCHGELSRLKPQQKELPKFFLFVSIGGCLGGFFIGIFAPSFFIADFDLSISILFSFYISSYVLLKDKNWNFPFLSRTFFTCLLVILGLFYLILFGAFQHAKIKMALLLTRNFYGSLKVSDQNNVNRALHHGKISHGVQFLDSKRYLIPTSYYGKGTGIQIALDLVQKPEGNKVGVIGLGVGTLKAYGRAQDDYRFYEINPKVIEIANSYFTFLKDTPAKHNVVLGDARLSLTEESPQNFDILAVDAFSGDSILVHLLTIEAFKIYQRHMNTNGIISVHISNRYLNLKPVLAAATKELKLDAFVAENEFDESQSHVFGATWILMTKKGQITKEQMKINNLIPIEEDEELIPNFPLWTDDYSSLYPLVQF